jgi:hypothetical protein
VSHTFGDFSAIINGTIVPFLFSDIHWLAESGFQAGREIQRNRNRFIHRFPTAFIAFAPISLWESDGVDLTGVAPIIIAWRN